MVIAYDKDKNRVHVDDVVRGQLYYCQTCGEELSIKRGNIRSHHFSHKNTSLCDGWHYDMSEWHGLWQKQFPIENQEVVFEFEGKKHRADVFINNTVIEFQHSKLSFEEFNNRNDFYNSLGYKVIWIFDAVDAYENGDIKVYMDNDCFRWNNALINFKYYDNNMVDMFFQEFDNIWTALPDYKNSSLHNNDLIEYAWLHHIDSINNVGPQTCCSTGKNNLYDYQFIDKFVSVKFLHDGSFDNTLEMKKKNYTMNDVSDAIFNPYEEIFENGFTWCPEVKHFVNPCDECHACIHLSENNDRCKYRFEKLLARGFDRIISISYSFYGKIEYIIVIKGNQRFKITYEEIPYGVFNIKEAFEDKSNTQIIRLRNIDTGWKVQINRYNYRRMLKTKKCYGKVQAPNNDSFTYSKNEMEIYGFMERKWELIWRR